MTAGELKKILENVPDDYILTINLEGMEVANVDVDNDLKFVDFSY